MSLDEQTVRTMLASNPSDGERSVIEREMNNLDLSIKDIGAYVNELCAKISPVTRAPVSGTTDNSEKAPELVTSPMTKFLKSKTKELCDVTRKLCETIAQLEL